ncbi:MAG TPA: alpha/beta hydrolase-fold protein [Pyrinomonadaceae bacterium]|jgi:predicted esterase
MNASPLIRRVVPALAFVLLLPCWLVAKNKIEKQSFTSNNNKRTFYLFVPETLNATQRAPLLLVFHGSGRNGLSLVEKWTNLAAKENFIVAGLDSMDSSRWSTTADNPGVLRDLVELLESKYPIDPRRVYLFGHSGGAVFAIDISMIESEYFAAAAVHAGSWREKEEFEMMRSAHRRIPIAIWVGTNDPFFSVASVRATRDALSAAGFSVEVTEMPGHDHWYYDLAPKINRAAWQFFQQHELPTVPRYAEFVTAAEASDANQLITEANSLQTQVMELVNQTNMLESQMRAKDLNRDRPELQRLAGQEAELLKQSKVMMKAAAEKAQRAAQMKVGAKNQAYLQASARYYLKFAEFLEAKRAEAEALLGTDSPDVINTKRSEARKKVETLQREVDELRTQAEKAVP